MLSEARIYRLFSGLTATPPRAGEYAIYGTVELNAAVSMQALRKLLVAPVQEDDFTSMEGSIMQELRKSVFVALAFILFLGAFSSLSAGPKGSETKGRHFFKDNCRQCHGKGLPGGDVTPMNKTMAQWREYFAKGVHNHGKEPLTQYLPADQLLDASAFLIQHAADSPQPETCGK